MEESDLSRMPLDPDRPMLEQLEEAAFLGDDQDLSWLIKEIYQNPGIMSLLTGVDSMNTKRSEPT